MNDFLAVCETAARAGGEVLLDWLDRINPQKKGPKDFVTEADLASQQVIREIIHQRHPSHRFLGEEDAPVGEPDSLGSPQETCNSPYRWIVDPLDGTLNYVHRMPSFAVSVALEKEGDILAGVVFDPIADECFTAVKGEGAFLNQQPIRTSECRAMSDALVAVSFAANVESGSNQIQQFVDVLHASQSIRRLGSAPLNLCYVGGGRLDGYFASCVKIWDVAAGVLIVREAGGTVTSMDGQAFCLERPQLACSGTKQLHGQLLATLAQAE
jgi:myo-inositol-1(or 4)-monophosphatase